MKQMYNQLRKAADTEKNGVFMVRTGSITEELPALAMSELVKAYNSVVSIGHYETHMGKVAKICEYYRIPCRMTAYGWYLGWRDYHPKRGTKKEPLLRMPATRKMH